MLYTRPGSDNGFRYFILGVPTYKIVLVNTNKYKQA